MTEHAFADFIYFGIYRDDGICVVPKNNTDGEDYTSLTIASWLNLFQALIDDICADDNTGEPIARVIFTYI